MLRPAHFSNQPLPTTFPEASESDKNDSGFFSSEFSFEVFKNLTANDVKEVFTKLKKKGTKSWERLQHDQQLQTNFLLIITFILFLIYMMSSGPSGNGTILTASDRDINGQMVKVIDVNNQGQYAAVGESKMMTKREKEAREGLNVQMLQSTADLYSLKRLYTTDRALIEAAQEKERPTSKELSCMTNYPKTIINSNSKRTYWTPRKVFDLPVLERSLHKLGYEQTEDMKKADIVLKGQPRVTFKQLIKGKQYYDMVASLGRIGSKKKTQLATLRNHVKKFGCSFESLHIQPKSFDMNKPQECKKFFDRPEKGKMWVLKSCKNGEGSKGAGIEVIDDLSSKKREFGECLPNAMNYVAQEYISHPLLVQGSKFDMRAYLFVASTSPYVVFFNPGYIRRSLAVYKPESTKKDDVLTNYHVQMTREDFDPAKALWSFSQFINYLKETKHCQACGDIEIQLAKIGRLVFDAGREYYKRHPGSFQIVGLDFMMDQYLNLYFIEGNVSPGLGSHKLKWKSQLMDDLIYLMYETTSKLHEHPESFETKIGERLFGPGGNYWELIVHEQHEKCNKEYKFNPCKELKQDFFFEGNIEEVEQETEDEDITSEDTLSIEENEEEDY